jgi:hypothetical protein
MFRSGVSVPPALLYLARGVHWYPVMQTTEDYLVNRTSKGLLCDTPEADCSDAHRAAMALDAMRGDSRGMIWDQVLRGENPLIRFAP